MFKLFRKLFSYEILRKYSYYHKKYTFFVDKDTFWYKIKFVDLKGLICLFVEANYIIDLF